MLCKLPLANGPRAGRRCAAVMFALAGVVWSCARTFLLAGGSCAPLVRAPPLVGLRGMRAVAAKAKEVYSSSLPLGAAGPKSGTKAPKQAVVPGSAKSEELVLGQELTGTVTGFKGEAGANLELGVGIPGWLHVSFIKNERVEKPSDVLAVGEEVRVRVVAVTDQSVKVAAVGRDLAIFQKRPLSDYEPGNEIQGRVVGCSGKAVFIDVGAMADGYLSADQIPDFDLSVELKSRFSVGQEVTVKVLEKTNSRLGLTLMGR
ncbi:unnamed protein product [Polarella glacialis]|uniref:S1 motif domain-containing protein n=1 Tax=Polarella glacialis TaxID=89957 RepID=A0A813E0M8_POLGL|nr:unnamed protein product [Polarella glacialis]CAE8696763.1 unnamed protein product [Polarella glacialis]|mmetsp:Transcript_28419/g.45639  ORF Transcript_28419/g.45639 Transcript_28419/m.45639 type:complete len:260 (+) Transcript_28419:70-849(+)